MADGITKSRKPLAESPAKASQPVGASLAFLGMDHSIPLLHGSQGCTAFGKVFWVQHFREPIPLQTTAMDQVSAVMGADDNLKEALANICRKSAPALIGVPSTGLPEAEGTDLQRVVSEFHEQHPEHADVAVVPVNTPDFTGCLESGFAAAVDALIDQLVPSAERGGTQPGRRRQQVNMLVGSALTPGDLEALTDLVERFGLRPVIVPDISRSLDGHLPECDFSPVTTDGTPVGEIRRLGDAEATLVIGPSLYRAADRLRERTAVPDYRFDTVSGLAGSDALVQALATISGRPVPERVARQRAQLQDAMLDTHFMLGQLRVAVAADPDLLLALARILGEMGAEVVAAVASARGPALEQVEAPGVHIGDLSDLEYYAREAGAELLIGNGHAAPVVKRLGVPLIRAGIPQHDRVGEPARSWVTYTGTRRVLFDLANQTLEAGMGEIAPYQPHYAQKAPDEAEGLA